MRNSKSKQLILVTHQDVLDHRSAVVETQLCTKELGKEARQERADNGSSDHHALTPNAPCSSSTQQTWFCIHTSGSSVSLSHDHCENTGTREGSCAAAATAASHDREPEHGVCVYLGHSGDSDL